VNKSLTFGPGAFVGARRQGVQTARLNNNGWPVRGRAPIGEMNGVLQVIEVCRILTLDSPRPVRPGGHCLLGQSQSRPQLLSHRHGATEILRGCWCHSHRRFTRG